MSFRVACQAKCLNSPLPPFINADGFSGIESSLRELQLGRQNSQAESMYIRKLSKQTPFSCSSVSLWFSFSLADHSIFVVLNLLLCFIHFRTSSHQLAWQPARPPAATWSHSKESRCITYLRFVSIQFVCLVITFNSFPHSSDCLIIPFNSIEFLFSTLGPQLLNRASKRFQFHYTKIMFLPLAMDNQGFLSASWC